MSNLAAGLSAAKTAQMNVRRLALLASLTVLILGTFSTILNGIPNLASFVGWPAVIALIAVESARTDPRTVGMCCLQRVIWVLTFWVKLDRRDTV